LPPHQQQHQQHPPQVDPRAQAGANLIADLIMGRLTEHRFVERIVQFVSQATSSAAVSNFAEMLRKNPPSNTTSKVIRVDDDNEKFEVMSSTNQLLAEIADLQKDILSEQQYSSSLLEKLYKGPEGFEKKSGKKSGRRRKS